MESKSPDERMCCKSFKASQSTVLYYVIHFVLVTTVTLPTLFYIFQPDHPPHMKHNGTSSQKIGYALNSSDHFTQKTRNFTIDKDLPLQCNSPLLPDNETGLCRPPCAWTTQSPLTQKAYFVVIVVGLWLALIATIITFITWASIKNLRKFPHVLRFHIMVCCVILGNCKMLPIHMRPEKTFCRGQLFWEPTGHSSLATVIQGAMTHYFGLAHSLWAMCFITNTYAVIVRDNRAVFKHPIKIHLIQSLLCWLVPAVIVTCCLYISPPGYKFLFIDLMAAGAGSVRMAYFAVTLPMQVSLGVSLCLLWSIVWHLRKARLDSRKRVIRAREERISMRRVERQFLSMAVVITVVVGVVMSVNTVTLYRVRGFIHDAEVYFDCLLVSKDCKPPSCNTVLSLINVVAPAFACLAFFFLLLMNKDCRNIWKGCFRRFTKLFEFCKPPPLKLRADTDRSRCSSTLTVLSVDRRDSELFFRQSLALPGYIPGLDPQQTRQRASSLTFPVKKQIITVSDLDIQIKVTPPSDADAELRPRCNSVPVFLLQDLDSRRSCNKTATLSSVESLSSDPSEISAANSETPLETGESFIQEIYSSKL